MRTKTTAELKVELSTLNKLPGGQQELSMSINLGCKVWMPNKTFHRNQKIWLFPKKFVPCDYLCAQKAP